MTLEEVKNKIQEIQARTDISLGQKAAMTQRVISQFRRANPDADFDELGV